MIRPRSYGTSSSSTPTTHQFSIVFLLLIAIPFATLLKVYFVDATTDWMHEQQHSHTTTTTTTTITTTADQQAAPTTVISAHYDEVVELDKWRNYKIDFQDCFSMFVAFSPDVATTTTSSPVSRFSISVRRSLDPGSNKVVPEQHRRNVAGYLDITLTSTDINSGRNRRREDMHREQVSITLEYRYRIRSAHQRIIPSTASFAAFDDTASKWIFPQQQKFVHRNDGAGDDTAFTLRASFSHQWSSSSEDSTKTITWAIFAEEQEEQDSTTTTTTTAQLSHNHNTDNANSNNNGGWPTSSSVAAGMTSRSSTNLKFVLTSVLILVMAFILFV